MKSPYEHHERSSQEILVDEIQLSFATALICTLIGLVALLANWILTHDSHLTALMVVGAFYGLMGLSRLVKLLYFLPARLPPSSRPGKRTLIRG